LNHPITRVFFLTAAIYYLFFFKLAGVGLLGPDEPRYASIGREMAVSGDWVTPRLWGEPWFEKPALLYWMVGAAFRAGLGDNSAPRLAVALLSLAFLVLYQRILEKESGRRAAWFAAAILSTSVGWIAYSHLGVTDLPLTATLAASMLLMLRWSSTDDRKLLLFAGLALGLAVLAKGLVPLVLALPAVMLGRKRWRDLLWVPAVALVVAAPWYAACTARHGSAFIEDFFWKHHVERFSSEAIQHVQPFWFYVPVLLAGLIPWTPVLANLAVSETWNDPRRRFLLLWFAFGFVFFSVSTNKLPGYLLPLLPPLCGLAGISLAANPSNRPVRRSLLASAVLLCVVPAASGILPTAIRQGITRAGPLSFSWLSLMPFAFLAVLVWWLQRRAKPMYAIAAIFTATVACVVYLKVTVLPSLDRSVSARSLWREIEPQRNQVCIDAIHRAWRYGLNYYSVEPLPGCDTKPRPLRVTQRPGEPARLSGLAETSQNARRQGQDRP
jgi:4-amino-4-deoxy-L-arabinose transferase-like glycosyltransferase